MSDRTIEQLEDENQKLWIVNRKLSRAYLQLIANVKQLQEEANILKNITGQLKKAEKLSFAKIDDVLLNINNLMYENEDEQESARNNSFASE